MKTNVIFAIQLMFCTYIVTNSKAISDLGNDEIGDWNVGNTGKPGGFVKIDPNDQEAIEVAKLGLNRWNKGGKARLHFKVILVAKRQIVNGVNYDIRFVAAVSYMVRYPNYICRTKAYKSFMGQPVTKTIDCLNVRSDIL